MHFMEKLDFQTSSIDNFVTDTAKTEHVAVYILSLLRYILYLTKIVFLVSVNYINLFLLLFYRFIGSIITIMSFL